MEPCFRSYFALTDPRSTCIWFCAKTVHGQHGAHWNQGLRAEYERPGAGRI